MMMRRKLKNVPAHRLPHHRLAHAAVDGARRGAARDVEDGGWACKGAQDNYFGLGRLAALADGSGLRSRESGHDATTYVHPLPRLPRLP